MKKIFVILLLFLVAMPVWADAQDTVYLSEIRTWVRNYLGGENESSDKWTDATVNSFINLSCREYATLIKIESVDTVLTADSTTDYDLPTDFIDVVGVARVDEMRKSTLYERARKAYTPAETPLGRSNADLSPKFFAIFNQTLIIDPPPADGVQDTLIVWYKAYATDLTSDSSFTNVPYGGVPLVVLSTVMKCFIMNREDSYVAAMLPTIEKMYAQYYAILARNQSDPEFNPASK